MQHPPTQKPQWALQFNIDDETWKNLCEKSQSQSVSALVLALEMGLLNENKLIPWERESSGVASLKAVFFNAEPASEIFEGYDIAEFKSAACLPLGTWNDLVFFAKLSGDPTGLENRFPNGVWVLAPWTGMKRWFDTWEKSKSSESKSKNTNDAFEAPAGLTLGESLKPIDHQMATGPEGLPPIPDLPPLPTTLPADPEAKATQVPDAPEGMKIGDLGPAEKFAGPVGLGGGESSKVGEGLDFGGLKIDDGNETIVPSVTKLDVQATAPSKATPRTAPPTAPRTAPPTASSATPPPPTPPPIPIMKPPPIPTMMPPASVATHSAPARAQADMASGGAIPTISLDQLDARMKHSTSQDALAASLIGAWQNDFDQVMIFLFQQEKLIFWWFNDKWKGQFKRGEAIVLDTPSIFKIVADTGHPYHGYVSPGPINDDFFKRCNGGSYPEHVTVVPIMAGDRVVSMVLGTCSKEKGKKIALNLLEDNARLFAAVLMKLMTPAQKAS